MKNTKSWKKTHRQRKRNNEFIKKKKEENTYVNMQIEFDSVTQQEEFENNLRKISMMLNLKKDEALRFILRNAMEKRKRFN